MAGCCVREAKSRMCLDELDPPESSSASDEACESADRESSLRLRGIEPGVLNKAGLEEGDCIAPCIAAAARVSSVNWSSFLNWTG